MNFEKGNQMTTTTRYTKAEQATKAGIIISQIGGRKFQVMTGVKQITSSEENGNIYVGIKHMKSAIKTNYLKITLNDTDTYDMEFGSIRGFKYTVKATENGVYAEDLQRVFTSVTGLNTSL